MGLLYSHGPTYKSIIISLLVVVYYTILYYTILYYTIPCHAMPCHAMPCHAMPCHAMPCHAMPCHAMPCHKVTFAIVVFARSHSNVSRRCTLWKTTKQSQPRITISHSHSSFLYHFLFLTWGNPKHTSIPSYQFLLLCCNQPSIPHTTASQSWVEGNLLSSVPKLLFRHSTHNDLLTTA